jgi:CheY-like chemotaxis protein
VPHVLLIEDNPHIQRIYSAKLQAEGFKVTTAENGEQGILWAEVCEPDVILLDIMLPQMDGFEVLKRLRADPQLARIPVFMLSNKAWAEDVQTALALGAREFFTKGSSTLQNIVERIRAECGLKKLMIIAANTDSAKPILAALQHPRVLCATCTVLAEAVTAVEHRLPDLVILDAKLANNTVFNLLQQLKATPATRAVPIIAITDDPQKLQRADGFVAATRIREDLRPVILKLLGLPEATETAPIERAAVA